MFKEQGELNGGLSPDKVDGFQIYWGNKGL